MTRRLLLVLLAILLSLPAAAQSAPGGGVRVLVLLDAFGTQNLGDGWAEAEDASTKISTLTMR